MEAIIQPTPYQFWRDNRPSWKDIPPGSTFVVARPAGIDVMDKRLKFGETLPEGILDSRWLMLLYCRRDIDVQPRSNEVQVKTPEPHGRSNEVQMKTPETHGRSNEVQMKTPETHGRSNEVQVKKPSRR